MSTKKEGNATIKAKQAANKEITKEIEVKRKEKASSKRRADKRNRINEFVVRGSLEKDAPVLKVNKITKKFGSFIALDEVSFEIARGERIGLIGGNGAGKTTISEIIAGINKPTSGQLEFGFEFNESPKEGIGMQFQQSTYPSGLTVKDIVSFAKNLRKLNISSRQLKDLLKVFQMQDFYNRKVRSLSGGQRQKLNILLSIIHNPRIVILDELSTGLDISAREEIIQFTDDLLKKNKMSAILISHHMSEIKALCSKVVVLDNGQVRDIKTIAEIEKDFGSLNAYSKKLIQESNLKTMQLERAKSSNNEEEIAELTGKTAEFAIKKQTMNDKYKAKREKKLKKQRIKRNRDEEKIRRKAKALAKKEFDAIVKARSTNSKTQNNNSKNTATKDVEAKKKANSKKGGK